MPVHDWTRVSAGTFRDFHLAWAVHLTESLNTGPLPEGYYALTEQPVEETAAAGQTPRGALPVAEAPPKVSLTMNGEEAEAYVLRQRTVTIRHASDHRIVALVEIAKDRERSVSDFVDKAIAALRQGYHLLLIDLLPPGPFDPDGLHGSVWSDLYAQRYEPPPEKPLCLASSIPTSTSTCRWSPTTWRRIAACRSIGGGWWREVSDDGCCASLDEKAGGYDNITMQRR